MIEIGIDAIGIDANASPDTSEVHTQIVGGSQLPFAVPGTSEPLKIPSVIVNFSLTKEAALKYARLIKEQAESLPDEKSSSDILTATSLAQAEQIAKMNAALTKQR